MSRQCLIAARIFTTTPIITSVVPTESDSPLWLWGGTSRIVGEIQDHFFIDRIEPGKFWLKPLTGTSVIGPIPVPNQVTALCEPGWDIGGVVVKVGEGKRMVKVWNVSPYLCDGEEEFDRLVAFKVQGPFFCCQEATKRMAEGGRIINLSSSTTALMLPGYAAFVATKGAVEQFSHVLAKALGPKKITVNVVSSGPTDTELFSQGKSEEQKQRSLK